MIAYTWNFYFYYSAIIIKSDIKTFLTTLTENSLYYAIEKGRKQELEILFSLFYHQKMVFIIVKLCYHYSIIIIKTMLTDFKTSWLYNWNKRNGDITKFKT